jgi:hypothetical protein
MPRTDFLGAVSRSGFEIRYIGGEVGQGRLDIVAIGQVVDHPGGARIEVQCRTNPAAVPVILIVLAMCIAIGGTSLVYVVASLFGTVGALLPNAFGLLFLVGAWYCGAWLLRDNRGVDQDIIAMVQDVTGAVVAPHQSTKYSSPNREQSSGDRG